MTQYNVCMASGANIAGKRRLVVVLQHRVLDDLVTVVTAPLYSVNELERVRQLRPVVEIAGTEFLVAIDRLAFLPRRQLGAPIANLQEHEYQLRKALDLGYSGF